MIQYSFWRKFGWKYQQGDEKVFEFKISLEELFWMLEDELSELEKNAKFIWTACFPPSTGSFVARSTALLHPVEAGLIEEQCLGEVERCTHGEDRSNIGEEGFN